jgi:integrase/recombinase XerD
MLNIFRRHLASCPQTNRKYRRCHCPIHVEGSLGGEKIRKSLDLTSWEAASSLIKGWEASGKLFGSSITPVSIDNAIKSLILDLRARHVMEATICKYRTLTNQLNAFCTANGITHPHRLTVEDLRRFRASWKDSAISAKKKLERLRATFTFFKESGWVEDNPASKLKLPRVKDKPTLPFTAGEMRRIFKACDAYPTKNSFGVDNRARIKALVLLLRYSGLRIGDAACLRSDRIVGGKLHLYTAKTGTPVYLPLPPEVLNALEAIKTGEFFFWSGVSTEASGAKNWQRAFRRLFKIAGIEGGHIHRFRDTFAVELLHKGIPLDTVSILLGHNSIRTTEQHYNPWVKTRQDLLEEAVRKTWAS